MHELGPRLTLELVKVEEGVCDGPVLFHAHVSKTEEEAARDAAARQARIDAKEARKRAQEANVARKQAAKAEKTARRKRRREQGSTGGGLTASDDEDSDGGDRELSEELNSGGSGDDGPTDAEWYQREVGQAPEEGLFGRDQRRSKKSRLSESEAPSKHKFARKPIKMALQ